MIILIIPEMNIIVVFSLIYHHVRFILLKETVGHMKVLYISDGYCMELRFITSYQGC